MLRSWVLSVVCIYISKDCIARLMGFVLELRFLLV